jgi:L-threonylcarbamoyladenylate synthase
VRVEEGVKVIQTRIIKVDKNNPELDKIKVAADIIKKGGLVAFPTETVYGLGGNALDGNSASKIYAAKGRPQDNPLIVHIHSIEQVFELVNGVTSTAQVLMDKFWPGPLTLIFKKKAVIPYSTTGGLDTVAIRMPNHPVALSLIRETGLPIAAPSANISGRPSPTCAADVFEDLSGKVDIILDSGPALIGVESTVLDITSDTPIILRPGGVTKEELEEVLGYVELEFSAKPGQAPKSPGQKYKHYAPKARMIIVEGPLEVQVEKIIELSEKIKAKGLKVGIMATAQTRDRYTHTASNVISVGDRTAPLTISSNLFSILRKFDRLEVDVILAEGISKQGLGLAVMNRLYRAAGHNIIKV